MIGQFQPYSIGFDAGDGLRNLTLSTVGEENAFRVDGKVLIILVNLLHKDADMYNVATTVVRENGAKRMMGGGAALGVGHYSGLTKTLLSLSSINIQ